MYRTSYSTADYNVISHRMHIRWLTLLLFIHSLLFHPATYFLSIHTWEYEIKITLQMNNFWKSWPMNVQQSNTNHAVLWSWLQRQILPQHKQADALRQIFGSVDIYNGCFPLVAAPAYPHLQFSIPSTTCVFWSFEFPGGSDISWYTSLRAAPPICVARR